MKDSQLFPWLRKNKFECSETSQIFIVNFSFGILSTALMI